MRRVLCTAPLTVVQGSYDHVMPCHSVVVGYSRMLKPNGHPQSSGRMHEIHWQLRPDGIWLGVIYLGTTVLLAERYGYVTSLRCAKGHIYDLAPGEIIHWTFDRRV